MSQNDIDTVKKTVANNDALPDNIKADENANDEAVLKSNDKEAAANSNEPPADKSDKPADKPSDAKPNDSKPAPKKGGNAQTLVVALVLCLVCSIMVSAVAVGLKPQQQANKSQDLNKNILVAADKFNPETDPASEISKRFESFDVRMVNLETGEFASDEEISAAGIDPQTYDMGKAARTANLSVPLDEDIAKIGGKPKFAKVYIAKDDSGALDMLVLPIHGAGLWGPIYALLTLDKDLNTIKGVNFYQHKETPGLGSRITEEPWRAQWVDKTLYDDQGNLKLAVTKAGSAKEGQIDGISGATLTIRGVNNLVQFWLSENGYKPFLDNLKANNGQGV